MKDCVIFKAVREVLSPERDAENAGFDFYIPAFNEEFFKEFVKLNKAYLLDMFPQKDTSEIEDMLMKEYTLLGSITVYPISDSTEFSNHFNIKIPSGIIYKLPNTDNPNTTRKLEIKNKSGVASKNSVIVGACVCDMEYRNEVIFNLIGFKTMELKPNNKIVQGVISVVDIPSMKCYNYGDDTNIFSEDDIDRGGGFGTTGLTKK